MEEPADQLVITGHACIKEVALSNRTPVPLAKVDPLCNVTVAAIPLTAVAQVVGVTVVVVPPERVPRVVAIPLATAVEAQVGVLVPRAVVFRLRITAAMTGP